ncbi:unnamed protein product [Rotaria sp. Silwood2]|nr:unnamed protein product [Rotaria sp. Silwood2]CAF3413234.1 unnamed protein product [Rotaria sp. Silwood2]CAF4661839.1 unnamed protein product [Rotaria sp. Silwood2]
MRVQSTCAGDGQFDFSLAHEMEIDDRTKQFIDVYLRFIECSASNKLCRAETTLGEFWNYYDHKQVSDYQ